MNFPPYHKIQSVYKRRDERPRYFIEGAFSRPEFELLKDIQWVGEEKIDGTNIRVCWDPEQEEVSFFGKTDRAQIPAPLMQRLEELFPVEKMKEVFNETTAPVVIYGEGFGKKIQKGSKYLPDRQDFCLFDVRIGNWWLTSDGKRKIASDFEIEVAPVVKTGTLLELVEFTKEGFNSYWGDFTAEGLVIRPALELFDRAGKRIITKVKYNDFPH